MYSKGSSINKHATNTYFALNSQAEQAMLKKRRDMSLTNWHSDGWCWMWRRGLLNTECPWKLESFYAVVRRVSTNY